MKKRSSCTLAVLLALVGVIFYVSSSSAQSFQRAPGQSFFLDLDVPDGSSSQWGHNDLKSLTALHAVVKPLRIGKGEVGIWAFDFSIAIQAMPTMSSTVMTDIQSLELRIWKDVWQNKTRLTIIAFNHQYEPHKTSEHLFQKTLSVDESIDVYIDWSQPGTVTMKVSDEIYEAKIPWEVKSVSIAGANGDTMLEQLEFGSMR
jgi:hypothetical protein